MYKTSQSELDELFSSRKNDYIDEVIKIKIVTNLKTRLTNKTRETITADLSPLKCSTADEKTHSLGHF